jgi:hypothetical protein
VCVCVCVCVCVYDLQDLRQEGVCVCGCFFFSLVLTSKHVIENDLSSFLIFSPPYPAGDTYITSVMFYLSFLEPYPREIDRQTDRQTDR